jgi:malate dehydrogenase (quinone)
MWHVDGRSTGLAKQLGLQNLLCALAASDAQPERPLIGRHLHHSTNMSQLSSIVAMIVAGMDNLPLTKYLIDQVLQSPEERLEALREFVPLAKLEDWELEIAGQRVQDIKQDEGHGGVLEFGTEVVTAPDGTLAALLGISPGASTTVSIMLTLLQRCFPTRMQSEDWHHTLSQIIRAYGRSLANDRQLVDAVRDDTGETLGLNV